MLLYKQIALIFLLLSGFLSPGKAQTFADKNAVMTFNIRYNGPKDGVNAWTNRKTKVADVIRFHKADLIGVQEAQHNQLKDRELVPENRIDYVFVSKAGRVLEHGILSDRWDGLWASDHLPVWRK